MKYFESLIGVDSLKGLTFRDNDVLESQESKQYRKERLYFAMIIGNNHLKKTRLTIQTIDDEYFIDVVVKAISNDKILLEKGKTLPVKAIKEVEIL